MVPVFEWGAHSPGPPLWVRLLLGVL